MGKKYLRVVKNTHEDSETVVRYVAGVIGLRWGGGGITSRIGFLFAVVLDRLTDEVRKDEVGRMEAGRVFELGCSKTTL